MWINSLTDEMVKQHTSNLKLAGRTSEAEILELLYNEVKRLNLIINNGETPFSTRETLDEETKAQLCE